ncbi:MAG: TonB-dependent receptor [Bacteroidales bacterium]|nr:TonB-dependent receptor [Bacteroidales bacterium]
MMNLTTKTIAISILLTAFTFPIMAQQQNRINPRVEVQRDYEGHIIEVEKPKLPAAIHDSISQFNITMDYAIFDKPYHDLYSFAPLPWVHLSSPGTIKQPWVHLRFGALYPTSPLADLFMQAPLSGASALLLTAQHRSFWGELPRYKMVGTTVADQMQNNTDIRYSLNWNKGKFEIGGGYDYNYYTYYGVAVVDPESFNPDKLNSRSFMRDNLAHVYSLYKADISLSSLKSVGMGTMWNVSANWSRLEERVHMWNILGTAAYREDLIRFNGGVAIGFRPEQTLGVALSGSLSNDLYDSKINRGVIALNPYYQYHKNRFLVQAGLILSGALDNAPESESFFFYPQLETSYQLIPDNLVLYADFMGENRHNNYQTLLAENPWLSQNILLKNSDVRWMIQVGFKGKIAHHLGYHIYGQHTKTNDQYHFQNNLTNDLSNTFSLSDTDEERLSIATELTWNSTPLTLHLTGKRHSYTFSRGVIAWFKPKTELNLTARYQWRERIITTFSAVYKGKTYAFPQEIDPYTHIGLQLEYRFAEWFGLYVEGQNLLNNTKMQNFLYYYEPGIRIGGGMTFRF